MKKMKLYHVVYTLDHHRSVTGTDEPQELIGFCKDLERLNGPDPASPYTYKYKFWILAGTEEINLRWVTMLCKNSYDPKFHRTLDSYKKISKLDLPLYIGFPHKTANYERLLQDEVAIFYDDTFSLHEVRL